MRPLFKLLATLAFTCLLLACPASAQERQTPIIDQVAFESNGLTTADIDQLTKQLRGRSCSGEEVRSQVLATLHNLGYLRATANAPQFRSTSDRSGSSAMVFVKVNEGARYRFGKLEVVDSTVFSSSRLHELFPVSDGDWYAVDTISLGLNSLRHLYGHAGYSDAVCTPELVVDDRKRAVDVYIHVQEGEHT